MRETWVRSLGWEDPLEKGTATHSSILENSMGRGAWRATVDGVPKSRTQLSEFLYNSRKRGKKRIKSPLNKSEKEL